MLVPPTVVVRAWVAGLVWAIRGMWSRMVVPDGWRVMPEPLMMRVAMSWEVRVMGAGAGAAAAGAVGLSSFSWAQ